MLFLDEPTAGIDPVTRKQLWDDFYSLSAEGKTLFVTTHCMEEAQRCNQLMFLSAGKAVAQGTPDTIRKALGDVQMYTADIAYRPGLRAVLLALDDIVLVNQFGNALRIAVRPSLKHTELEAIIRRETGNPVVLAPCEPNLEDVFIAITRAELATS